MRAIALLALLIATPLALRGAAEPADVTLAVGEGHKLAPIDGKTGALTSTVPEVAVVFANGFVVGLKPGQVGVRLGNDLISRVRVVLPAEAPE